MGGITDILILIPAAGSSSRMRGADKLLERVRGQPQLARVVQQALATGCRVVVTLPGVDGPRTAILAPHDRLRRMPVPDAAQGMSASLRAGVAVVGDAPGLMVVPADMPDLETEDFLRLAEAFLRDPDCPLRAASQQGLPGHPVILPRRLFASIAELTGDQGARSLLEGERVPLVALPGQRAITDLDTPEDWAAWREAEQ